MKNIALTSTRIEPPRGLPIDVHVDHEIPLRGQTVSGLHVLANLNILFARANLLKGNN